ncbi:signal transduction histidine kinase [Mycetocola sp. 2940]
MVVGNAAQLEQALHHLVHNAIKFTPAGGRLTLSADSIEGACGVTAKGTLSGTAVTRLH